MALHTTCACKCLCAWQQLVVCMHVNTACKWCERGGWVCGEVTGETWTGKVQLNQNGPRPVPDVGQDLFVFSGITVWHMPIYSWPAAFSADCTLRLQPMPLLPLPQPPHSICVVLLVQTNLLATHTHAAVHTESQVQAGVSLLVSPSRTLAFLSVSSEAHSFSPTHSSILPRTWANVRTHFLPRILSLSWHSPTPAQPLLLSATDV